MPEDPKPEADQPNVEIEQVDSLGGPGAAESEQQEEDVGDFINRHVFERDSVFFEG